jgi:hypothetical protein
MGILWLALIILVVLALFTFGVRGGVHRHRPPQGEPVGAERAILGLRGCL